MISLDRSSLRGKTGLLVSIRSVAEAELATTANVDLLDIKEPARGSLGQASSGTIQEIARCVAGQIPLSCAAGELIERIGHEHLRAQEYRDMQFVKLGLAGCRERHDWLADWVVVNRELLGPHGPEPVAVVYADWRQAEAPTPGEVLDGLLGAFCRVVLVDTFAKGDGDLFDHWERKKVADFVKQVRLNGGLVVLAGSLRGTSLLTAKDLNPDLIAVRGAVCAGGREGSLQPRALRQVCSLVSEGKGAEGGEFRQPIFS